MTTFQHVFEAGAPDAPFTAVLLHGTGADERDLLQVGRMVAPGAPILSPLGKVREHGMPRWFRRLAEGVFDEDDIKVRAAELADFLRAQRRDRALPPLVAIGFSNGANMAAALLQLEPDVLAGAVLLRAMPPLAAPPRPGLQGVPVFIGAGTMDTMIPPAGADRLRALLDDAGADVTLRFVEAGHGLTRDELVDVRAWLQDHAGALSSSRT